MPKTISSDFSCPNGGKHEFDQLDYDGNEYGHCVKCGCWIDTDTGENETKRFEEEEDEARLERTCGGFINE